jgi:hypothetical protein
MEGSYQTKNYPNFSHCIGRRYSPKPIFAKKIYRGISKKVKGTIKALGNLEFSINLVTTNAGQSHSLDIPLNFWIKQKIAFNIFILYKKGNVFATLFSIIIAGT